MEQHKKHAYMATVLVITPQGIPLVRDPAKPLPHYWKLPGGRSEDGETPLETGVRELCEETGIRITPENIVNQFSEDRENHVFFLFVARLAVLGELLKRGSEGEDVAVFSPDEVKTMPGMHPGHQNLVTPFL